MKAIYKYPLEFKPGFQTLELPEHAQIIHVAEQEDGQICLWAMIDTTWHVRRFTFMLYLTGQEIHEKFSMMTYIGTVLCKSGFVVHVFKW